MLHHEIHLIYYYLWVVDGSRILYQDWLALQQGEEVGIGYCYEATGVTVCNHYLLAGCHILIHHEYHISCRFAQQSEWSGRSVRCAEYFNHQGFVGK